MMIRTEIGGDLQRGPGERAGAGSRLMDPSARLLLSGPRPVTGFPLAAQSTSISLGNVSI